MNEKNLLADIENKSLEELSFDKYLFKKKLTLLDSFFSFFSIAYYLINFIFCIF